MDDVVLKDVVARSSTVNRMTSFGAARPLEKRPFDAHPDPRSLGSSHACSLLFWDRELVTRGQRLRRYDDDLRILAVRQIDPALSEVTDTIR